MKIIITGPNGMLGSDLIKILQDNNTDIIALGRDKLDITDKNAAMNVLRRLKADVLVHAAAFTKVDMCESKKELAFMVNGDGTANIAEGCRSAGTKMIYISTDYIFDGNTGEPYFEDETPNPLNIYGKSKLAGENCVKKILDDYIIVRTSWLFGMNENNFVKAILEGARKKTLLKVVDDQTGSPTFSGDLSYAIKQLIKKGAQGAINVANSGKCSWYTYAKKCLELSGHTDVTIEPIPSSGLERPAVRPKYSVLNCDKFSTVTGAALRPWEEALEEYISTLLHC